jgi:hypothetical protein
MVATKLYVVAECPASPGFGGVFVLRSATTGRLVFFAPCCGIAWREAPLDGRLDVIDSLSDLAPGGVLLPSLPEIHIAAPSLTIVREELADNWIGDIPGLRLAAGTSES